MEVFFNVFKFLLNFFKGVSVRALKKTKNQLNISFSNGGEVKNSLSREIIEESGEDDSGTEEVVDEMNKLDIQLENDTEENSTSKREQSKSDSNGIGKKISHSVKVCFVQIKSNCDIIITILMLGILNLKYFIRNLNLRICILNYNGKCKVLQ